MIILDTHIWIWWIDDHPNLTKDYKQIIEQHKQANNLDVSINSCWESSEGG